MSELTLIDALFWTLAAIAVLGAVLTFLTASVVRAAFLLMLTFVAIGAIVIMLGNSFVGNALVLIVAGEMVVLAVMLVMLNPDPAGMNPLRERHQNRAAMVVGIAGALGLSASVLLTTFPDRPVDPEHDHTAALGTELLTGSMLAFQTAAVLLLATMVGAIVLSNRHGRFGDAYEGSVEPEMEPAAGDGAGGDAR